MAENPGGEAAVAPAFINWQAYTNFVLKIIRIVVEPKLQLSSLVKYFPG